MITWVEASAGSGKTYYLVNSIHDLLESGVAGYKILCISFSNTAADEMRARLHSDSLKCSTLHGFCNTFSKDSTIMNRREAEDKITDIINDTLHIDHWFELMFLLLEEWPSLNKSLIDIVYQQRKLDVVDISFENTMEILPDSVISDLNQGGSLEKKIVDNLHNYFNGQTQYQSVVECGVADDINVTNTNELNLHNLPELFAVFLTKDGDVRKRLYSKAWAIKFNDASQYIDEYALKIEKLFTDYTSYNNDLRSNSIAQFVKYITDQYEKYKIENKLVDFTDLLKKFNMSDSEVLQKIMEIRYIFVDEAQDLSADQWKIVLDIYKEIQQNVGCELFVVGDPKQQIYVSDEENILKNVKNKLQKYAKVRNLDFETVSLNDSYRSSSDILEFVDIIMEKTQYPTKHNAKVAFSGLVELQSFDYEIEIECVIRKILELQNGNHLFSEDRKIKLNDIVILIKKRNAFTLRLFHELQNNNIPVAKHPFYVCEDCASKTLINIGKMILFDDQYAFCCVARSPFFQWSFSDLELWFNEIHKQKESTENEIDSNNTDILHEDDLSQNHDLSNEIYIKKYNAMKEFIANCKLYGHSIKTFYMNLIFHSEYGKYIMDNAYESAIQFWHLVIGSEKLSWIEFFDCFENGKNGISYSYDGIAISTIHASKGLEYPIVFVIDDEKSFANYDILCEKGKILFPNQASKSFNSAKLKYNANRSLMNKRLLYVAMTRSQEQMYIFCLKNSLLYKNSMNENLVHENGFLSYGKELTKDRKALLLY